MRLLLIADVHGNLPALAAVLRDAADVDGVACAGDVAGYFPFVDEVVERMAALPNLRCVKGNHDAALLDERLTTRSVTADLALRLQRGMITARTREFVAALPVTDEWSVDGLTIRLFHGSPRDPLDGRERYWEDPGIAPGLHVSGHAHVPHLFATPSRDTIVVNPGGVGFPRDGDPRASFAIFETRERRVTFRRAEYDVARLATRCAEVGLPPHLAKGAARGTWVRFGT